MEHRKYGRDVMREGEQAHNSRIVGLCSPLKKFIMGQFERFQVHEQYDQLGFKKKSQYWR